MSSRWRVALVVVVAGLALPAPVACGGGGAAAPATRSAARSPSSGGTPPTSSVHSAVVSPPGVSPVSSATSPACEQTEPPATGSGDAWAQAASAIGNPSIILRPASVPSGFGPAKLAFVCNSGGAAGYTVTYTGANEGLTLCLGGCGGAFGNTPGPPAYIGSASIRHEEASVLMTAGMGNGSAFSYYQVEWNEGGQRYVADMGEDSTRLAFANLRAVVTSLAPMAGSEPPTAGATATGAASSATPVPIATPEQCSEPSPTPSDGDAWAQVATALGGPGPVLRPASVPSAFGEPRLASLCNARGDPEYTVVYESGSESLALCINSCSGLAALPGTPDSVAALDIRGTTASVLSLTQPEGSAAASAYEIRWLENQQFYTARLVSAHFKLADLEAIVTALAPPK